MPVEILYESRDAVPESLASHVVERDGKFVFQAEPLSVVSETQSKLKKLRADLDAKAAALGKYGKLNELGDELDIDELLELRELKKQGKPLAPDEKSDIERQYRKQLDKLSNDLKARDEGLTAAQRELQHYKLTVPLRDIAAKAGVGTNNLDLMVLDTAKRFKLDETGKIIVLDDDGDDAGITPKDFFEKLYKAQRPNLYDATGAGGSGAKPDTTAGKTSAKTITRAAESQMTPQEKAAFYRDGGTVSG